MIERRSFLQGAAALAMSGAVPAFAAAGQQDAALAALLQRHGEAYLRRMPQEASSSRHDPKAYPDARGKLDDRSQAARERDRAAIKVALSDLSRIDRGALSSGATLDYDVARFVYTTLDDLLGRYGFVDLNLRPSPYVVQQMGGAWWWLPGSIGERQPLDAAVDVEHWLSRLDGFAIVLDQETDLIRYDAANGVTPPSFVIDRTIPQLKAIRDEPPAKSQLIAPMLKRIAAQGYGDQTQRAETILRTRIVPAFNRQIAALEALRPRASDTAGVWRLPDGEAYYASALRANTTANVTGGELHKEGLEQCRDLSARIDRLLKAQGLTKGTVGERLAALDNDPRFRATGDEGRARLLALADQQIKDTTAKLGNGFHTVDIHPVEVRRMAPAVEPGSPGAMYHGLGSEGKGLITVNLLQPEENAAWRMPTLIHHEGVPGHHYQASVMRNTPALPLFRQLVRFSAYSEGWALYAENVADELGVYENNPFGQIGGLQSQLFRAARIVVDTGMHHERWNREQAVKWMVENAGEPPISTDREIVRYCVIPGQACAFKVGANRIFAAREAARAKMGARFDVRDFHDLVLKSGPVPMGVLEASVAAWAADKMRTA
ncbi:DUF885 domain-containing protein [Sphingoaurantiacus capsulatus]|uniref:DUF885 domain-containing protein n=1 Tax=Sphingoaurantiacus capsulatus TaxID=1771310 RepID=A0ABV7XA10_9SPHN